MKNLCIAVLYACAAFGVHAEGALSPIGCVDYINPTSTFLLVAAGIDQCEAVVAEWNKVDDIYMECDWDGELRTGRLDTCPAVADALNRFDGIAEVDCYSNGGRLFVSTNTQCLKVAAKMNEMLTPEAMCNRVGTYQTDGTCDCTDPNAAGSACEFSNSKNCNDAGVVDALGQCTCTTNDPAVGGIGPSCAFTNAKTCSDAGVAQADGSCVCNGPATGLGLTCKEYTSSKTCNGNGDLQVDKSCVCTTNDPAIGGIGPYCNYTNANTCSDAGVVQVSTVESECAESYSNPFSGEEFDWVTCCNGNCIRAEDQNDGYNDCSDGSDESYPPFSACSIASCVCTDAAGASCEYSNAKTCSDAGVAQADGSCVCNNAGDAQAGGSCASASRIKATSIIGPVLGGISFLIGIIVLVVRVRHADNKWDEILIVCRCKDRETEDGDGMKHEGDIVINVEPKKTKQSAHVKHNPMFDATAETATKPDMDVKPSSTAAPKAKKKKKKTPNSIGANSVGKRCTVNGYDCKGTIRFVGPHHETGKDRVGVELDEAVGKHSGTVNGNEYFSCGKKCGVLVDTKKVSEY